MKEYFKKNKLSLFCCLASLLLALFYTAMRINYSGISKFLGADKNPSFIVMYLPVIVLVIFWLSFIFSVFSLLYFKSSKKWPIITSFSISGVFLIGIIVIVIEGSADYLRFIVPHFLKSLLIVAVLCLLAWILFFPVKNKIINTCILLCAIIASVFVGYDIKLNYFSYGATVYAVENTYQIVFTTNDNSLAWVEINNKKYEELYAGSMKSKDLVHKIIVPQSELDNAKSYTICAEQLIYRGPFGAYKGKTITKNYNFTPVNSTDGIKFYSLSDVHESVKGAVNAAKYYSDMDFLVILGDVSSMVETIYDANLVNKLAYKITKGEKPVVYARGNHEIKGEMAEELYKYVGCKDENFYYTFELGNKDIYGITLDIGEDHDDGWWEYYGSDDFDSYRDEQTKMLENILAEKPYEDYKFRLTLCHIPVVFVNSRKDHEQYKKTWTSLLNEIGTDLLLSGHQHELSVFEPDAVEAYKTLYYNKNYKGDGTSKYNGYLTDFDFPSFMLGRKSFTQKQTANMATRNRYTGLVTEIDFVSHTFTSAYTNSKGNTVPTCNIFSVNEMQDSYTFGF